MAPRRFPVLRRGVSLVEALVALAVMAFGMLALVGVQATMRLNSDVAKQRGEATRIATEEIEKLRGFSTIGIVANEAAYASYDGMVSGTAAYNPAGGIGNTTYTITRTVVTQAGSPNKSIAVRVNWTDRSNQPQTVTLETAISGTDPALAGLLSVMPTGSVISRNASIPPDAVDQRDGTSRFKPPGSTGGIYWLFNNLTGLLRVCSSADVCIAASFVSGTVKFHRPDSVTALTLSNAENPEGLALNLAAGPAALNLDSPVPTGTQARCFATQYTNAQLAQAGRSVDYFCSIQPVGAWGGQLNLGNLRDGPGTNTFVFGTGSAELQVCRYTQALPRVDDPNTTAVDESDPDAEYTANADHPKFYCREAPGTPVEGCKGERVATSLTRQDFLVIRGDKQCPANNTTPGSVFNTRRHQSQP
jgi:Tfp pilus assembly protein PilV